MLVLILSIVYISELIFGSSSYLAGMSDGSHLPPPNNALDFQSAINEYVIISNKSNDSSIAIKYTFMEYLSFWVLIEWTVYSLS